MCQDTTIVLPKGATIAFELAKKKTVKTISEDEYAEICQDRQGTFIQNLNEVYSRAVDNHEQKENDVHGNVSEGNNGLNDVETELEAIKLQKQAFIDWVQKDLSNHSKRLPYHR